MRQNHCSPLIAVANCEQCLFYFVCLCKSLINLNLVCYPFKLSQQPAILLPTSQLFGTYFTLSYPSKQGSQDLAHVYISWLHITHYPRNEFMKAEFASAVSQIYNVARCLQSERINKENLHLKTNRLCPHCKII